MAEDENPYFIHETEPVGEFSSPSFLERHPDSPILTKQDIPYPCHLVFNCSVLEEDDGFVMMFRNEVFPEEGVPGGGRTNFGLAHSEDGVHWQVEPEPVFEYRTDTVGKVYDPRLVVLDGRYVLTCCAQTPKGPRAAIFVSDDLREFDLIELSLPASRNTLLFPEKIGGKYWRLERPFWEGPDGYAYHYGKWFGPTFDIWTADSPDMEHWGHHELLIETDQVPYANIKIGPGATPIRTDEGWLLLIHGVDFDSSRGKNGWEERWPQRYHGGVALLDLEDPTRLIGLGRRPFLTPEAGYEVEGGYRNNVVFPMTGLVRPDGNVMIYYGAADAVIGLATAPLDGLLAMCEPV
jgi:beta-1,4-mannooligosaccharide/beta-1,4-mannosyl-N-acetylglucosamine phosphorylase